MNKPKTLLITLFSTMALSANASSVWSWFGTNAGDDGKATTVGNVAAQTNKVANSQNGKLKFNLVNKTNTTLTSAVLKDPSGKVLFTTTKGKTCAVNDVCVIQVDKKLINTNNTFFFYDSKNRLVSAYSFFNVNNNPLSIDAQADLASLGVYVFNKIKVTSPNITFNNLATSFYNIKDQKDPFTALGDYYLDFLGANSNDSAVIKELAKQINSNEPLLINPNSTRVVKAPPMMVMAVRTPSDNNSGDSSTPFCSSAFKSSMDLLDTLSFIPIPGLNIITAGAKTAADIACGEAPNYLNQFTEINAKLDAISGQLDAISSNLKSFNEEWRSGQVAGFINSSKEFTNNIDTILDSYYFPLLKTPGPDKKMHNSLQSLVAAYGGVDKAMKNKAFADKINQLVAKSTDLVSNYKNMVVGSDIAKQNLDKICKYSDKIVGEVISTRLICNYSILQIYTGTKVRADAVETFYNDYNKAFGEHASPSMAVLNTNTITSVTNSINVFNPSTIYNPLDELDTKLVNNIKAIPACNVIDPTSKTNVTQITEWYGPNNKDSTGKPYIVTRCFGNSENGVLKDQITSKYFYKQNDGTVDSDVVNVLGVLTPKRFFNGDYGDSNKFSSTSWVKQSDPQVYASGDGSSISGKYFVNTSTAINNQSSSNPRSVPITSGSLFTYATPTSVSRNNTTYTRNLFVPQFPSSVANALELKTSFQLADYWGSSPKNSGYSNNFYTYMRTIDSNNIGYVWAIKNDMYREWQPSDDMFYFRTSLLCMTNDCKVSSEKLVFDRGATASETTISFKGNIEECTNSDSQVVDRWASNTKLYVNDKTGF